MEIKDLNLEVTADHIIYKEEFYLFTKAGKDKLIKKIIGDKGSDNITIELKKDIHNIKAIKNKTTDGTYDDLNDFLFDYCIPENNLKYDEKTESLKNIDSDMEVGYEEFKHHINVSVDNYRYLIDKDDRSWSKEVVFSSFMNYKYDMFHKNIKIIKDTIRFDKENLEFLNTTDEYLDELLEAMNIQKTFTDSYTGLFIKDFREVVKLVFKQTLWLIKRNLFNLPTKNEIMMFFFGPQGTGKSFAFNKLFGTIFNKLYLDDVRLDSLLDDRQVDVWTRRFVINFDDAGGDDSGKFNTKSMGMVKNRLTGSTISYRPMGTNESITTEKKFTAISTINFDFKELIQDRTGARRFFQFATDNKINQKFDRSYFEAEDIAETVQGLWMTIDENDSEGFLMDDTDPLVMQLLDIQNTYIPVDTLDEFIKEYDFVLIGDKQSKTHKQNSQTTIFKDFKDYCETVDAKTAYKRNNFFKELNNRILIEEITLSNGKTGKVGYHA